MVKEKRESSKSLRIVLLPKELSSHHFVSLRCFIISLSCSPTPFLRLDILSSLLASLHPIWLLFLLNFCPQVSESQFLSKSTAVNQAGPICVSPHALLSYTQLLKQSSSCSPQNDWQFSFMVKPQCPVGSSSSRHHINCSGCSIASVLTDSQSGFLPQGNALGQTRQT